MANIIAFIIHQVNDNFVDLVLIFFLMKSVLMILSAFTNYLFFVSRQVANENHNL